MKKMITLLFAATLLIALTACGKTNNENKLPFETQIQKVGTLVVGTSPDYAPFEFLNKDNKIEGFDIDLMNTVAALVTASTGAAYEVEYVPMEFSTIVSALKAGQVDLGISFFTYDEERDALFSTPYLHSQQVVVVNAGSDIVDVAGLAGKKVAVQLGSTGETAAMDLVDTSLLSLADVNIMFESLKNNAVDAVVVDKAVADMRVANAGFVVLAEPLVDEEASIIVKNGNKELLAVIDEAIAKFKQTDDYLALLKKWNLN